MDFFSAKVAHTDEVMMITHFIDPSNIESFGKNAAKYFTTFDEFLAQSKMVCCLRLVQTFKCSHSKFFKKETITMQLLRHDFSVAVKLYK